MDRLEAMSIVLAVAEAGSLSAAARRLNTPIATASRQISELEEHLRTKLFDRTARKLALTVAGSSYVAASKRICLRRIFSSDRRTDHHGPGQSGTPASRPDPRRVPPRLSQDRCPPRSHRPDR